MIKLNSTYRKAEISSPFTLLIRSQVYSNHAWNCGSFWGNGTAQRIPSLFGNSRVKNLLFALWPHYDLTSREASIIHTEISLSLFVSHSGMWTKNQYHWKFQNGLRHENQRSKLTEEKKKGKKQQQKLNINQSFKGIYPRNQKQNVIIKGY